MDELQSQGYSRYNDFNRDWEANLLKARMEAQQGNRVAISDVMFCDQSWRDRLKREMGTQFQWIFMENDPWQCARNCLFRFAFQKPQRPLQQEIEMIRELSARYSPFGDIRPVPQADARIPPKWVQSIRPS